MRIQIDKHGNVGTRSSVHRVLWVISPGNGERQDYGEDRGSLHLEIDRSWPEDRIYRCFWESGDRHEFLPDAEFEANVQAFIDNEMKVPEGMSQSEAHARMCEIGAKHEDDEEGYCRELAELGIGDYTREEVIGILNERHHRWSYSQGRVLGLDTSVFERMEEAWRAAKYIFDFGATF